MKQLLLVTLLAANTIFTSGMAAFATAAVHKEAPAHSQTKPNNQYPFISGHYALTGVLPMNGYRPNAPTVLIVDKGSHSTYVLQLQKTGRNDQIVRILTVSNAIGTIDKPTPSGRYLVSYKKMYPEWIPPKTIDPEQKKVPPYNETHKNPLGVAAIFLNGDELALHGTNAPKMIRKSASHGCIRHSNADIERLYGMVKPGTPVYIVRKFRGTVLNRSDFIHETKSDRGQRSTDESSAMPSKKPLTYICVSC